MNRIEIISSTDNSYPEKLSVMGKSQPPKLYVRGNAELLTLPGIAVVGTRKPSEYSTKVAPRLTRRIVELSDRVIISGLALGCDTLAHQAALECGGKTIAVLPSGLDAISPASNRKLAESIIETGGCLVSAYEPSATARKYTYVQRDAIIAALADITLVVESAETGGTMHTVDNALKYLKTVACFYPSDMTKGNYSGNDYLVKCRGAKRIANLEDLKKMLEAAEMDKAPLSSAGEQLTLI